jgi:phosphoribosylformylglycinamidine cyclo-ligase
MTQSTTSTPLSYKDAGVDIDAGDALVERIKPLAKKTMREGVLAGIGGFGALFEVPKRYQEPVLVSGTDGVGTKLKLAFEWNMHDTVGIDLVAMSVNDVLVQGAEPLFFLDYFACGKLDVDTAAAVVGGIAKGCELSGCALIGGETAEMPGMYPAGEYDLAGFCVGAVEKSKILTGKNVQHGDVVLGLASSGVHSNGFSLVRKCIERAGSNPPATLDGKPFKQALMEPTRLYVKNVLAALAKHPDSPSKGGIKALAHITGGGLLENIPRVLPEGLAAQLRKGSWPQTDLFAWLQKTAGIDDIEMNRTFNNGIGMVIVVNAHEAFAVAASLGALGEKVYTIGVIAAQGSGPSVVVV